MMSVTVFTGAQSDSGSSCENPVFLFSRGSMIFCLPPPVCYMHSHMRFSVHATNICRVGTSGWCTEDIRKSTESAESTLMLCKSSPSVESHCSVAHNSCANTFSSKNRCLGCWCIWNGPRSKRQLFCSKDSPPLGWALKTCFLYWSGAFCGWWGYEHQMPHTHLQRCPRQQRGWADKDSPVRLKVMSGIQT